MYYSTEGRYKSYSNLIKERSGNIKNGKRTLEDFNLGDAQKIANAIAYALSRQYPGVKFEMIAKEKDTHADQSKRVSTDEPLY